MTEKLVRDTCYIQQQPYHSAKKQYTNHMFYSTYTEKQNGG